MTQIVRQWHSQMFACHLRVIRACPPLAGTICAHLDFLAKFAIIPTIIKLMIMTDEQANILLIEDEEVLANMYETKFKNEGFKIRKALDGEEGLKLVAEEKPELILLDIIMPKLDGFSVLKRLKANEATKNIPVVLLTNLGQNEDVDKGQKLGAMGYLVKANLTPSEVVNKVKEFLNK
jgi:CheY-like chemotaxis protein